MLSGEEQPTGAAAKHEASTAIHYDPECAAKITAHRESIVEVIREQRPRFVPSFEKMRIEGHTITVSVPSRELHDEILRNNTLLLNLIVRTAGVEGMVELAVEINEEIRAARPIKLEDRVKYMTEKNPLLNELRKALDMDVE